MRGNKRQLLHLEPLQEHAGWRRRNIGQPSGHQIGANHRTRDYERAFGHKPSAVDTRRHVIKLQSRSRSYFCCSPVFSDLFRDILLSVVMLGLPELFHEYPSVNPDWASERAASVAGARFYGLILVLLQQSRC